MTTLPEKMQPSLDSSSVDQKIKNSHFEYANSILVADQKEQGDYSGATAKTSPEEIRLVRKLDMRIMPIMWAMYFLNYVSEIFLSN